MHKIRRLEEGKEISLLKYYVIILSCLICSSLLSIGLVYLLGDAIYIEGYEPVFVAGIGIVVFMLGDIFIEYIHNEIATLFISCMVFTSVGLFYLLFPEAKKFDVIIIMVGSILITLAMFSLMLLKPRLFEKALLKYLTIFAIIGIVDLVLYLIFNKITTKFDWYTIFLIGYFISTAFIEGNKDFYCTRNSICCVGDISINTLCILLFIFVGCLKYG